jgi:hypothetical protein
MLENLTPHQRQHSEGFLESFYIRNKYELREHSAMDRAVLLHRKTNICPLEGLNDEYQL